MSENTQTLLPALLHLTWVVCWGWIGRWVCAAYVTQEIPDFSRNTVQSFRLI